MELIKIILLILLISSLIKQLVDYWTYGMGISKKIKKLILENTNVKVEANWLNGNIITISNMSYTYIGYINGVGILSKYYVYNEGVIYRWTKEHKLIKNYYKLIRNEENSTITITK